MPGNGYYDKTARTYLPKSVETWDDYQGTSAGDDWDSLTTWQGTAVTPLEFTTTITDYGSSEILNYYFNIDATAPADVEVRYGDTVDSSGGSIDSYSTVTVTPNSTGLTAKKARYWQFKVSIDYLDSAGDGVIPAIFSLNAKLSAERVTKTLADIDSSTLGGSLGARQLSGTSGISSIVSIITQPHTISSNYVADSYVASDYVENATTTATPSIFVDKTTDPVTLNIYDIDSYGKRKTMDCTFDAIVTGNVPMVSDAFGNILRG